MPTCRTLRWPILQTANDFVLQHETTGGFADNTGSVYACTATVTDSAGNASTDQAFAFEVTLSGIVISERAHQQTPPRALVP